MSALLSRLPGWVYGTVLLLVLAGVGMLHQRAAGNAQGRAAVQKLWNAEKVARAAAEEKALAKRLVENKALAEKQVASAAAIKKVHDEEINTIRARIAAAERMRRPAFCANSGSAASAGTGGAEGGTGADPAGGVLPDAVAGDIQALILETEQAAATGRACQAFVRENGLGR